VPEKNQLVVDVVPRRATSNQNRCFTLRFGEPASSSDSKSIKGDNLMRFIVMVRATKDSESGVLPDPTLLEEMGKFNEELVKAGVMLAGEGLHPSSKGARLKFSGPIRTITDGPFPETRELIAGFWMWKVNSREEAIQWLKRCPHPFPRQDAEIELRQVYEPEDFGPALTPELRRQEEILRTQINQVASQDNRKAS
jgi:hypothetical protein